MAATICETFHYDERELIAEALIAYKNRCEVNATRKLSSDVANAKEQTKRESWLHRKKEMEKIISKFGEETAS